jgi:ribosomal protein S18 acetylase RimI-like enzyme
MGVKEIYRQQGLGKALLYEQFRRMRQAGAVSVLVETDRERDLALTLYGSVGFRTWRDVRVFRKAYD